MTNVEVPNDERMTKLERPNDERMTKLERPNDEGMTNGETRIVMWMSRCVYPEGIASHSPGLPAQAGYPGLMRRLRFYPERVASLAHIE